MSDYRRSRITGGTFFFTVVTHERQPTLTTEAARTALREAIQQARTTLPFQIDAWVLLPDHLHCLWTLPEGDANFSARWAIIKRRVSGACAAEINTPRSDSERKRNEHAFWQRRFWEHQIRDDADMARHLDYIHWNPVKHGLVKAVKDWPYSSFHKYVVRGTYPGDWGGGEIANVDDGFGE
ncbi:MAG: transposase [Gammaproteobacteria bacterium]|nr:transposase [Gammaproteobacteria bacterium]